jgi:hypothetical protein
MKAMRILEIKMFQLEESNNPAEILMALIPLYST